MAARNKLSMPSLPDLMVLTVHALRELGGSGHISEIYEKVVELASFTQKQLDAPHTGSNITEIEYQLAWARTHLKYIETVENSARAVWSLTELGYEISDRNILKNWKTYKGEMFRQAAERKKSATKDNDDEESTATDQEKDESQPHIGWKELVLKRLAIMDPKGFERLSRQLLREAGFQNTEVLGKSSDGGIDGRGVYKVSLVSFPVYFQCKRWKSSVGAQVVHDFRGAMAGRGDKGLLITTSSFTPEAITEARRDGAPPVDLVDGNDLCDLLKELNMGVTVTTRQVEEVTPDLKYFDRFE